MSLSSCSFQRRKASARVSLKSFSSGCSTICLNSASATEEEDEEEEEEAGAADEAAEAEEEEDEEEEEEEGGGGDELGTCGSSRCRLLGCRPAPNSS
jgi:hypothetical protein